MSRFRGFPIAVVFWTLNFPSGSPVSGAEDRLRSEVEPLRLEALWTFETGG